MDHEQKAQLGVRGECRKIPASRNFTLDIEVITMYITRIATLLLSLASAQPAFAQSTFDLVVKGKSCVERKGQQIDCDYRISTDFWLSIAAVGSSDAGITFMKSDFKGKYYGTVGIGHGCVIVKTGTANTTRDPFDFAFVSPKNGKVYLDWPSCRAAR